MPLTSLSVSSRDFSGQIRPSKPSGNADDFPFVLEDGSFDGGANHRIEAGSIAASGTNADAANVSHRCGYCVTVIVAFAIKVTPLPLR